MNKGKNLTEGNISKILISLAIPIVGASFLQMTYGLVDMIWIGRIGSGAVAAIGTATFFLNLGEALNSIVVMGGGIKASHSIGAKQNKELEEYINSSFFINLIISLAFIIFLFLFKNNLINFFNLGNIAIEKDAKIYLQIVGVGLFFKFANILYMRLLNSFGETKLPFKISCVGVILNIILDPILIFGFNLGVAGAAIATLISQAIITFMFIKISKRFFIVDNIFKIYSKKITEIISLGTPIGIQRVLFTGIGIIIGKIIADFGPDAIAAQKIGLQIESISYMTVGGLYGAVASFIGQNYGAQKFDRIKKGYKLAVLLSVILGTITTILFTVFPKFLVEIFVKDLKTVEIGINYLRIVGISQIFMCAEIVTNGSFNGIGVPKTPSIISVVFTSLRIPLAYFLGSIYGINGIWMTISITMFLRGTISPTLFIINLKKLIK
ncbi:MAG: MATE family efflux transporter [Cetobacterium sp.]|uniref:MATE family efflux transporter n=1 Tax=Cetobacterium sp. TaxID=2071632 RepID=UPI002FCBE730